MTISILSFLPVLTGVFTVGLVLVLSGTKFEVKGVVGPYFGALAVMFGLFASLMAGDTWRQISLANGLLAKEVNLIRGINVLSEELSTGGNEIRELTRAYVEQDIDSERRHVSEGEISLAELPALIGLQKRVLSLEGEPNLVVARIFNHVDELRNSRTQRLEIKRNHSGPRKLAMLILLGALTQLAIAMCHAGNKSAAIYTVGLFSIAFILTLHFITVFDYPENFATVVDVSVLLEANMI